MTAEQAPLGQLREPIAPWGPYLSERAPGTVDERGLGGICDRHQRICFAVAMWNGGDPLLQESFFGLTRNDHVKECLYYIDSTPPHSYTKFLYQYHQQASAYEEDHYCMLAIEYAKEGPDDILIRITATNCGPESLPLHILPTIWFRNTWSSGQEVPRPFLRRSEAAKSMIYLRDPLYGRRWLACEGRPLFIVSGNAQTVRPHGDGTEAAAHYFRVIPAGESVSIRLRVMDSFERQPFAAGFDRTFRQRKSEADKLHRHMDPADQATGAQYPMRQLLAAVLERSCSIVTRCASCCRALLHSRRLSSEGR